MAEGVMVAAGEAREEKEDERLRDEGWWREMMDKARWSW